MPNRLARSTSPYLQQHADNPVDWYEWGEDAFAEARRRDVPLLISVGYAACHWCHVMAHESFEDERTAAFMNAHFVNVKVDREERPDVDAVYMAATQAMTGQGGWPMTVFATPDGDPFFCGTYFPPRPAHGMPSFGEVLASMAGVWTQRRADVDRSAATIREAMTDRERRLTLPTGPDAAVVQADLDAALERLAAEYDARTGGFGGAPKFPPSTTLAWLLARIGRTGGPDVTGDDLALRMAEHTLHAMARGGLYDQLAGGFARYSVDADWVVPHFEKMLYDNAQLLRVYLHWWRLTGHPTARRVATETADWLLAEMRTPEGGFASSLDADSLDADGVSREGAFYAWTPAQLREVLGDDDGAWAAELLDVTEEGSFEHGTSTLQLPTDPGEPTEPGPARWAALRDHLRIARDRRARPGRDDKVVAGWNGMAVTALAEAGALLGRPEWVAAAGEAGRLLLDLHVRPHGGGGVALRRASRDGAAGSAPGVLEDYAHVAAAFLTLTQVTGEASWLGHAGDLLEAVLTRFPDEAGGFYDTAEDETDAVLARMTRPRDVGDGPAPAGQAAAAGALLTYAALTGSARHREAAEAALVEPMLVAGRFPRAAGWALAVAEAVLDGPRQVAVVGRREGAEREPLLLELHRTALMGAAPGTVVAIGAVGNDGDDGDEGDLTIPLLRDRPAVDGRPTAYVCRGFVCHRPTSDPGELAAQLRG